MRVFDWGNPKREFRTVAFDPTGSLVAAGGGAKATVVWDVVTGVERTRFRAIARSLRFHPHTGRLILATKTALQVGDVSTGTLTDVVTTWDTYVPALAADEDWAVYHHKTKLRETLTGVSRFGAADQATLWSVPVRDSVNEVGHMVYLSCLPNHEHFLSAEYQFGPNYAQRRRVAIRSRADGRVLQSQSGDIIGLGHHLFGSSQSDTFVVQNGTWLRVYRVDDLTAPPHVIQNDGRKHFTGIAFHPSGRYLAATSNDATVKLYDTTTWEVAKTFTWDIGRMRSIAFSPDGTLAAAGSDTGKVVVWDVDL